MALRRRLGLGLGTIPAGLYDLVSEKWASILHYIHINILEIYHILRIREDSLNRVY